ncbi:MAG: hypothetical protein J5449_11070 [Oscillospiraceae bacterium]|nr:hypothetical protein [Oscillospiraceae bacterium]
MLFRGDFRYNILDLSRLLCCRRDWIEDNILANVLHIHLNRFFRDYVIAQADDLSDAEFASLSKGHYFFSERDLARYWSENTSADKKTEIVDLAHYLSPNHSLSELETEKKRHLACLRQGREKALHRENMAELLTEQGFELFLSGSQRSFEWRGVAVPDWYNVRGKLISEAIYRGQNGYTTSSSAHVRLYMSGATRIKLGSRTLWLPNDAHAEDGLFWAFPVQAHGSLL